LLVLAVPLALICLGIYIDSPGSILYTQDRMGFLGNKFKLYKFRTMVADADEHIEKLKHLSDRSGPVFKMKNDPRVTHIGKWLRRFSLDELPQIFNVLKGDMSLVGPRPQVLYLENWSLGLDLKILLRTFPAIFAKEGAY
jgi:lipopolysaccharide/colanic/teichoic acid biosynthesis glycosyltransferase